MAISREKKALGILIATLIFLGCFVVGYVVAGHSLNAAVTNIDDAVGALDGYTVVLFDGTQSTAVLEQGSNDLEGVMGSAAEAEGLAEVLDAEEAPSSTASENAESSGEEPDPADLSGVFKENAEDVEAGLSPLESLTKNYQAKGAATLYIDVTDPAKYVSGEILSVGQKYVGVMSASEKSTKKALARVIRLLKSHDVSYIVCLTDKKMRIRGLTGITLTIVTDRAANATTTAAPSFRTTYVRPPVKGAAGAAIIGPGNVVTVRTQLDPLQEAIQERSGK